MLSRADRSVAWALLGGCRSTPSTGIGTARQNMNPARAEETSPSMNYVTPPSVLVVEDESDLRQLVGDSLQAAGFEPVLVATAAEAMSRLDAFAFDALVVDLRLPDADGMDVLAAATERYPGILGVVVTGFGGVDEAVDGDQARGDRLPDQAVPARTAVPRAVSRVSISSGFAPRTPSSAPSSRIATASTASSVRARRCGRSSPRWSSSRR